MIRHSFHAYKSVAPLKPTGKIVMVGRRPEFPRLQKRGPIEARALTKREGDGRMFPRLQKRGPIEALSGSGGLARCLCVSTLTKAWPH